jgi:hypothetical protein
LTLRNKKGTTASEEQNGNFLVHPEFIHKPVNRRQKGLRDCPEVLEVRYTTRAMVVHYNDGKVVPLRPRTALNRPVGLPERAAA